MAGRLIEGQGFLEWVSTPKALFTATQSFVRPANTTAYAANQRVAPTGGAVLEITGVTRELGDGSRLEGVRLYKSGVTLTNASFRVHLFRTLPVLSVADGAALFNTSTNVLSVTDITGRIGHIDVTMDMAGLAGASGAAAFSSALTVESGGVDASATSLWALIETRAAYVPASAESFRLTLQGARG